jgi:tRNA threonylcarbamoyl adenosine modification protein YeaZ
MTDAASWLLVLDSATNTIVVAAGRPDGELLGSDAFEGRFRHSQELLPAVQRLVDSLGLQLRGLGGVVVGTGPGAFTGLRVGLATAKTLAHELRVPVVGVATSEALLAAAGAARLWLPSGPRDRLLIERGKPPELVHAAQPEPADAAPGDVAVDLDGRASAPALERGRAAVAALSGALLRIGAARLAAGDTDDPERLVPAYAVPPRGAPATEPEGGVAWSRDPH